jgi:dTDP-4-dehydrorhamnose reductase
MTSILVTGANGQLGRCIQDIAATLEGLSFVFTTKEMLDISDKTSVEGYFSKQNFHYCINTAAYTNVEQAEKDAEQAFRINAEGAKNLAEVCSANNTTLIHISTDYVFDGEKETPYTETDTTNPINVYGASKLKGEQNIQEANAQHYILRTSWLYSQYGHNFLSTILKHAKAGNSLTITNEQTGTPTNTNNLALLAIGILTNDPKQYGVFHFSNDGQATWFDFAEEILKQAGLSEKTTLAETDYYRTFAKRPKYSVLNSKKIEETFNIQMIDWKRSLESVLNHLELT